MIMYPFFTFLPGDLDFGIFARFWPLYRSRIGWARPPGTADYIDFIQQVIIVKALRITQMRFLFSVFKLWEQNTRRLAMFVDLWSEPLELKQKMEKALYLLPRLFVAVDQKRHEAALKQFHNIW